MRKKTSVWPHLACLPRGANNSYGKKAAFDSSFGSRVTIRRSDGAQMVSSLSPYVQTDKKNRQPFNLDNCIIHRFLSMCLSCAVYYK